jgi:hypothetical protein
MRVLRDLMKRLKSSLESQWQELSFTISTSPQNLLVTVIIYCKMQFSHFGKMCVFQNNIWDVSAIPFEISRVGK